MKTVPGTLIGIHYNRTNGSVANDEFHIYVTPYSFSAEYWPENPEEWVKDEDIPVWYMTEKKEKITEEQWKLSGELQDAIIKADKHQTVENLYRRFKQKRSS